MDETPKKKRGLPKPPKGDSETGFYRYDGTPIQLKDREYYESNGCVFKTGEGGDIMPDGIHLKPRRIRNDNRGRKKAIVNLISKGTESARDRWESLPSPKPPFMEWYVVNHEVDLTSSLVDIARDKTEAAQNRIKATSLLLEYVKSKPKSQLEVSQPLQPTTQLTPQEFLDLALADSGIDPAKGREALRKLSN